MEIHAFDPDRGLYHFRIEAIQAALHAHPVTEIILSEGGFTLLTENERFENVRYALIKQDQPHAIEAVGGLVEVIMCEADVFDSVAKALNEPASGGVLATNNTAFQREAQKLLEQESLKKEYDDERVKTALQYAELHLVDELSLKQVAEEANLSPGRFSHLFKEQVGVSFSSYLIWLRLKKAISGYLSQKLNLTEACHLAGFHDSSHFTRHFKKYFGVKPSFPYNSSIVQV